MVKITFSSITELLIKLTVNTSVSHFLVGPVLGVIRRVESIGDPNSTLLCSFGVSVSQKLQRRITWIERDGQ